MALAIIIPSYNEAQNIENLIHQLYSEKINPHPTVIVVDDNSPDGTGNKVAMLKATYPTLHLIKRSSKNGRGSAVLAGFAHAVKSTSTRLFLEMDADFSHNPAEIPALLAAVESKTIAIASRYVPGGQILLWPFSRKVSSLLANNLIRFLLHLPLADNTNGYRCYSREAVTLLLKHTFITKGYIALSEASYLLYRHGFSFQEVPTVFRNRQKGKSNTTLKEFWSALTGVIRIKGLF